MFATTTTAHTVSMRPTTLAALLATAAAASIGATWGTVSLTDRDSERTPAVSTVTPETQAYIDGITTMTPAQLAAAYGYNNHPSPATQAYIDGITTMTPAQLAAAYGYNNYPDPTTQAYIDGITTMTPAQLAAAYGYNNYPTSP